MDDQDQSTLKRIVKTKGRNEDKGVEDHTQGNQGGDRNNGHKKIQEEQEKNQADLYCYCRKENEPGRFYIQCDYCKMWYHGDCV